MKFKIVFAPPVKQDIQEAVYWYNSKQKGLGKRFLNELKNHINIIKENPQSFAVRYDNIRCLPIKEFPFMIHYTVDIDNKTIYIYAVFHTSRNPDIWKNR